MSDTGFDFQKFISDTKEVLTSPKNYFASMQKTGGFVDPAIRAAIYGFIAGIFGFMWGFLHFSVLWAYGTGGGITSVIVFPIFAVIGLFIGSVIMLIISAICGGSTDFETNVRVTASLMVLYPIHGTTYIYLRHKYLSWGCRTSPRFALRLMVVLQRSRSGSICQGVYCKGHHDNLRDLPHTRHHQHAYVPLLGTKRVRVKQRGVRSCNIIYLSMAITNMTKQDLTPGSVLFPERESPITQPIYCLDKGGHLIPSVLVQLFSIQSVTKNEAWPYSRGI